MIKFIITYRDWHYWGRLTWNHKAIFRFYLLWGFSAADLWSQSEIKSDIDVSWGSGYAIDQTSHNFFYWTMELKIKRRDVWCMWLSLRQILFVCFLTVIPTSSFNLFKCFLSPMLLLWIVCARACACKNKLCTLAAAATINTLHAIALHYIMFLT